MKNKFEFIRGTFELYKDKLIGNPQLINQLIIDDLLIALGYDKRRNTGVIMPQIGDTTWLIYNNDTPRFLLDVQWFDNESSQIEISDEVTNKVINDKFPNLIVTNGQYLVIYYLDNNELIKLDTIKLFDTENSEIDSIGGNQYLIINAISCATYNIEIISTPYSEKITRKLSELLKDTEKLSSILDEENNDKFCEAVQNYISNTPINNTESGLDNNYSERIAELEEEISTLECQLTKAEEKNTELVTSNTEISEINKTLEKEINSLRDNNKSLKDTADTLELKVSTLTKEIEEAEKNRKTEETDLNTEINQEGTKEQIKSYIKQIEELTLKVSSIEEDRDSILNKYNNLINKMENTEDKRIAEAKELLDTVEDNEEDRRYIAVIGDQLVNYDSLNRFVGNAIQELYKYVNFELMPIMFDGDIFNIKETKNTTLADLMINNKFYIINLESLDEDSVLAKLAVIFKKFPSVTFLYKKIGVVKEPSDLDIDASEILDDSSETIDGFGEEIEDNFDETEDIQSDNFDDTEDFEIQDELDSDKYSNNGIEQEVGEFGEVEQSAIQNSDLIIDNNNDLELEFTQDSDEPIIDIQLDSLDDGFSEEEPSIEEPSIEEPSEPTFNAINNIEDSQEISVQAKVSIFELGMVFWNTEAQLGKARYIVYGERVYRVTDESLQSQVSSIMYALLAYNSDIFESIHKIREIDFPIISNFVSEETSEGINIPYTKYYLNIDNFGKAIPIIQAIANGLILDKDEIFIVFDAIANENISNYIIDNIDEQSIRNPEQEINILKLNDTEDIIHCIISGNLVDWVVLNPEQYDVLRSIIKDCLAFRTNYYSEAIKSIDDVKNIITEILANSENPIDVVLSNIGNVPDTSYKVISMSKKEVDPEDNFTIEFNGDTLYVSDMEPWQLVYTIINLHILCSNNMSVGLRVELNKALYEYYSSNVSFINPMKDVVVKAFVRYAESRLK